MQDQSALGGRHVNRLPGFNTNRQARVTSAKDFHTLGRIEVLFIDYSQPMPVWVVGDVDREPVPGDFVIIGYMDGRKDMPFLQGFVKNQAYTTNFIMIQKDKIKLQLPVFAVGVKDGTAHNDVKTHLMDNAKQNQRAFIELTETHVLVSFPTSEDGSTPPATITVSKDAMELNHPKGVTSGGKRVALAGDVLTGTTSDGKTVTGTIT
jgi:hypothetical protein